MILKTLSLKNFRKFKDAMVEFPDGVTGVVGLNGVGKSTIFESIAWVLYGPVAARTSADQIKREGAVHTDACRVELEFVFEDDNYRIVREMSGKNLSASATATVNGKVAATGAEIVSSYIEDKLGMDFRSFFTSIFAKQKELNALSSMIASERRPLILRMLGIDSLDDIIKEIKSDKKEIDALIERLSRDLIDENGKDKIETYCDEIKKLEKKEDENKLSIKKVAEKTQSFKKELEELEKELKKSKSEYEKIKDKKESLSEKKTLFENKEKIAQELKVLSDKIDERKKVIEQQKKKLEAFKDATKDIESSEKRLNELDFKVEELVKKIEQKKTLVERSKQDIREIDLKKRKIEKIGPNAKCPTCERVLADQYKTLLKTFNEEAIKNEKEIESLLAEVKSIESEKDRLSREKQALQKKRNYLETQIREKERIETTVKNITDELNQEKTDFKNKQQRLKELESVKFDAKEYAKVVVCVEQFYKKYEECLEQRDGKKDELNILALEFERKESDKKLVSQKIDSLKEKTKELEEYEKRIKQEKASASNLDMLSEVMSSFRTHLISRIRPTLSSYSSDFFERLTDGKYRELELDENYDLLVYENGNAYGIERFSGGEEDLANLCLRLAISEVITERSGGVFSFIILDEIFGSQDAFRRQNIMKALNGLSSKFRQIFLITHVEDVKDDMENILYINENEDGTSSIKIE